MSRLPVPVKMLRHQQHQVLLPGSSARCQVFMLRAVKQLVGTMITRTSPAPTQADSSLYMRISFNVIALHSWRETQSQLGIRLQTRVECQRLSVYIPESKEREKPQLVASSAQAQCLTSYPISPVTNYQTSRRKRSTRVAQFGVEIISAQQTALCNYAKQFSDKQRLQHASNGAAHIHTHTHTHSQ